MNKRKASMLLIVASLALSACSVGSREVLREERDVKSFDEISFTSIGELEISQGETTSLTVIAEENVLDRIRTSVSGERLHIDMRTGFPWVWGVVPTKPIRFELTVTGLQQLDLAGAGTVDILDIETERLSIALSGAGKVRIVDLDANSLKVTHSGLGSFEASGRVVDQSVTMAGAGDYNAEDLESELTDVSISGLGTAKVWATERLDVEIAGAGSLVYYGDPRVSQDVSGLGSVRSGGNR